MKCKLSFLALALLAYACGGSPEPVPEEVPGPALVSTNPADGAAGITDTKLTIAFTFDQNIICSPEGQQGVQVDGGAFVSTVAVSGPTLSVTVSGLSRGKSYVVTLPAGTVKGYKQNQKSSAAVTYRFSMKEPDPPIPGNFETAAACVKNMGVGWNLGNTLESNSGDVNNMWIEASTQRRPTDYENAWGQTDATRALIHMFKEAGFGAIRVPVTWYPHMGSVTVVGNYWDKSSWSGFNVDRVWMARVKEVVDYVIDEGMYCILNVHHDTGTATTAWLRADKQVYAAAKDRYVSLWTQIATEFESYGEKLVFESFNEMLDVNNTWTYASKEADDVINTINADFVAAVRATGGNNVNRNLILNTYAASPDRRALQDFKLPEDVVQGHLMAQVHSYAPYHFAFNPSAGETWSPQLTFDANADKEVRNIIDVVGQNLVARGIPCILGEFGTDTREGPSRDEAELAKQAACYISQAAKYNIPCFYWMALSDGKADRAAPRWTKPDLKDAILKAYQDNKSN
ncbi:MAG: cellulase family glycosylhydrolase [Bacteroidales bacterium]|nr:cellulase family glycosylhydrolase [Bacteroidales bacterium]